MFEHYERYKDNDGLYTVIAKTDEYEKAKAVEEFCHAMIDGEAKIQPVRHGHWITNGGGRMINGHLCFYDGCYCSVCEEYGNGNYCPNCGAKMDEET